MSLLAQSGQANHSQESAFGGKAVKKCAYEPNGSPLAAQAEPKMGHPHFQNVRLKLNAALDCEAAHSVVTGISHWYQVIRQAAKFFHLLCGFERSSASPFGCAITSTPTETTRAEHVCATRSVLPVIVDDLPS